MAEPVALSSTEQGWATVFDVPKLSHKEVSSSELHYRFSGSTGDGVYVSLYVNLLNQRNTTKKECRAHYQSKTSRLLMVDQRTIKIEKLVMLDMVSYKAKIEFKNKMYDMPNTHFYFMLNGHCADLHVGGSPSYLNFDQVVTDIKSSLIQPSLNSNMLLSNNLLF